ncbi:hypothetical protein KY348_01865 [Candidatus Woesearchaeota archaeon]|nr:hypothetical protein [Candidatus Woesearchaeota archaeon]
MKRLKTSKRLKISKTLGRKAQISHVFTYLVILLVVGAIILFGYKGIMSIIKAGCQQQRISFEKSLYGFIDEFSNKGSVREEVLKAPCDIEEVCFADSAFCEPYGPTYESLPDDEVIKTNVMDCTANIFFKGEFTETPKFSPPYSDKISLKKAQAGEQGDYPFKCFKVRGGDFKFLFTGLGRKTQIESVWKN